MFRHTWNWLKANLCSLQSCTLFTTWVLVGIPQSMRWYIIYVRYTYILLSHRERLDELALVTTVGRQLRGTHSAGFTNWKSYWREPFFINVHTNICLPYTDSYICILYIPSYHIHAIRMHPSTYVDGRCGERLNTIARTVHVLGEIITITLKCNNCVWTRSGRLQDDLYKIMRPVMVLRLISYRYKISTLRLKISHYIPNNNWMVPQ